MGGVFHFPEGNMPSRRIKDLHPDLQPLCLQFMRRGQDARLDILITGTFRNNDEQNQRYPPRPQW